MRVAAELSLLRLLLLSSVVCAGEAAEALKLRRRKRVGRAWLERASQEKLGWKQRCEIHVEGSSRRLHVCALTGLAETSGVDVWNVASLRMPVRIAPNRGLLRME